MRRRNDVSTIAGGITRLARRRPTRGPLRAAATLGGDRRPRRWPQSHSDWPSASPSECSAAAARCSPCPSWSTCLARACTRQPPHLAGRGDRRGARRRPRPRPERRVCWRHAGAFIGAALPGVIVGTALGNSVSGAALIAAFAIIMLLAAVATWRKASDDRHAVDAMRDPACPRLRLGHDLAAGALIGAMTGFFGVDGGFLIVPCSPSSSRYPCAWRSGPRWSSSPQSPDGPRAHLLAAAVSTPRSPPP